MVGGSSKDASMSAGTRSTFSVTSIKSRHIPIMQPHFVFALAGCAGSSNVASMAAGTRSTFTVTSIKSRQIPIMHSHLPLPFLFFLNNLYSKVGGTGLKQSTQLVQQAQHATWYALPTSLRPPCRASTYKAASSCHSMQWNEAPSA